VNAQILNAPVRVVHEGVVGFVLPLTGGLLEGVEGQVAPQDVMAAHSESYSPACSATSRTALSRTSGEYFLVLFMTPSSQAMESPAIPGRFTVQVELGHHRRMVGLPGT
jgi:hypothetical protein